MSPVSSLLVAEGPGGGFDISLEYGGNYLPERVLLAVNRALATIRAVPLPRP